MNIDGPAISPSVPSTSENISNINNDPKTQSPSSKVSPTHLGSDSPILNIKAASKKAAKQEWLFPEMSIDESHITLFHAVMHVTDSNVILHASTQTSYGKLVQKISTKARELLLSGKENLSIIDIKNPEGSICDTYPPTLFYIYHSKKLPQDVETEIDTTESQDQGSSETIDQYPSSTSTTHGKDENIPLESTFSDSNDSKNNSHHGFSLGKSQRNFRKGDVPSPDDKEFINFFVNLIHSSRFARVRGRIPWPAILYNNKYLCRSGSLSREPGIVWEKSKNTLRRGTRALRREYNQLRNIERDYNPWSNAKSMTGPSRKQDIKLLKLLNVTDVVNLMLQVKRKAAGIAVCSSENSESKGQYSHLSVLVYPFPGTDMFSQSIKSLDGDLPKVPKLSKRQKKSMFDMSKNNDETDSVNLTSNSSISDVPPSKLEASDTPATSVSSTTTTDLSQNIKPTNTKTQTTHHEKSLSLLGDQDPIDSFIHDPDSQEFKSPKTSSTSTAIPSKVSWWHSISESDPAVMFPRAEITSYLSESDSDLPFSPIPTQNLDLLVPKWKLSSKTETEAKLSPTEDLAQFLGDLNISWENYKEWNLTTLIQNYTLSLLTLFHKPSTKGILLHCLSGWDRTPFFTFLIRTSLWADGLIQVGISPQDYFYLSVALDWFLFWHKFTSREKESARVLYVAFRFLRFLASPKFSMFWLFPKEALKNYQTLYDDVPPTRTLYKARSKKLQDLWKVFVNVCQACKYPIHL